MFLMPQLKQDDVQFLYDKAAKQGLAENSRPLPYENFLMKNAPLEKLEAPCKPLFNALDVLNAVIWSLIMWMLLYFVLIAI